MTTTTLFETNTGGIQVNNNNPLDLGTLNISNMKKLRVTCIHRNGPSTITVTLNMIEQAGGQNAGVNIGQLSSTSLTPGQNRQLLISDIVFHRLQIQVQRTGNTPSSITIIVMGDDGN